MFHKISVKNLKIEAGLNKILVEPDLPFSKIAIDFLDELSISIFKNKKLKFHPELASYAFWSRKGNLLNLKKRVKSNELKIGKGFIFHLPPSNVPINCIYSFSLGLLFGNSNIIKVPSKDFIIVKLILIEIKKIMNAKKFRKIKVKNCFVRYDSQIKEITQKISEISNVRMIWGGNDKVQDIKKIQSNHSCIDIPFYDKYSFSVINMEVFKKLRDLEFKKLVDKFYSDAFFMDQNACGSPHLIFWIGKRNKKKINKFWNFLYEIIQKKYNYENISTIDKLVKYNEDLIDNKNIKNINNFGNILYVANLVRIPKDISKQRGRWGYFYQFNFNKLNKLKLFINNNTQTMSYFGFDRGILENFIKKNNLTGIDRIVPIGKAHDIDIIWDGYDLSNLLTRTIKIE